MKKAMAFLCAVVFMYALGVVLITQFNISRITDLGYSIALSTRLHTSVHDWLGMLSSYLPLIAFAFAFAFLFTGLFLQRFMAPSAALYALAGFVAILALHLIANFVFGIVAIAPTRTLLGLAVQAMVGGFAGYLFYRLAWKAT